MKTKLYIDFSRDEDIEYSLDELLRTILKAPLYEKPEIGKNPFRPLTEARPDRTSDGVRELMITFIRLLNKTNLENVSYSDLIRESNMPRLVLDKYFNEAMKQGLVTKNVLFIDITEKGCLYAEDHQIIDA